MGNPSSKDLFEQRRIGLAMPAMRDVMKDWETGLILHLKDWAELARAIPCLLDGPALYQYLGRKGRHWVLERFDWHQIADRYGELTEALISACV